MHLPSYQGKFKVTATCLTLHQGKFKVTATYWAGCTFLLTRLELLYVIGCNKSNKHFSIKGLKPKTNDTPPSPNSTVSYSEYLM